MNSSLITPKARPKTSGGGQAYLHYLKQTLDLHLEYSLCTFPIAENQLWGYVDSDWACCPDNRRSTSGYVLMSNGAAISWRSKRKKFTPIFADNETCIRWSQGAVGGSNVLSISSSQTFCS